jgi:hypothetical protein
VHEESLRCKKAQSKKFFFEKKNQKTFAPLRAVVETPGPTWQKVFAELFYKKATSYLRRFRGLDLRHDRK